MKHLNILLASLALSLLALSPATASAEDELDVTMEVLDSFDDIDGDVIIMEGPDFDSFGDDFDDQYDDDERRDGDGASLPEFENDGDDEFGDESDRDFDAGVNDDGDSRDDLAGAGFADDFSDDEDFESDREQEHTEDESDFDEGDDIDIDEPDEEPMHEDEPFDGKENGVAADF